MAKSTSLILTRSLDPHVDLIALMYSILLGIGGIYAYMKVGSLISFIMGLTSSSIGLWATLQVSRNPSNFWLILCLSMLLMLVMSMRFVKTGKWIPSGLLAVFSLLLVSKYTERWFKQSRFFSESKKKPF